MRIDFKWINLYTRCRRANWLPTAKARVCSWHFPEGWEAGPTRFAWNENKRFTADAVKKTKR